MRSRNAVALKAGQFLLFSRRIASGKKVMVMGRVKEISPKGDRKLDYIDLELMDEESQIWPDHRDCHDGGRAATLSRLQELYGPARITTPEEAESFQMKVLANRVVAIVRFFW